MDNQGESALRAFFGPILAWVTIGLGLLLMVSGYLLHGDHASSPVTLAFVLVGEGIMISGMAYLVIQGRRSWRAWFWFLHLDDDELLLGRKK
jgi:hypothetical protein